MALFRQVGVCSECGEPVWEPSEWHTERRPLTFACGGCDKRQVDWFTETDEPEDERHDDG